MKNLTPELKKEIYRDDLVLLGYRGSIAHNMYIPNTNPDSIDDIDTMGIFLFPPEEYLGLNSGKETEEKFIGKYDMVFYEFKKFVRLLLKSNPNVLGMLWLQENHYLYKTDVGRLLLDNREIFSSKLVYESFTGYAYSQLKRMTHNATKGYMGEKRRVLVEKYGFDCSNASHCIRLLKTGIGFLSSSELNVFRHDAPMLLEIKRGEWSLEKIKKEAERLFVLADEAYVRSDLPNQPDYEKANELVVGVMRDYLFEL
jgi:hypothetical protein